MNSQKIKYFRNFKYCFFTRNGGVSVKNFRSLNCAYKDEENPKNVKENREIIKKKFCKKKKLILLNQVHSNKVVFLNKKIPKVITGDGVITNRKDLCLGILTADCAPIIVIGKKNFGIIHVGWRGAFSDIIKNTVKTFISIGETNDDLNFFIGPHIQKKSFEVKNDFVSIFLNQNENFQTFLIKKKKKFFFDFSGFLRKKIFDLGISRINISRTDTFRNPRNYFSYRYYLKKGINNCGRQISLVCFK